MPLLITKWGGDRSNGYEKQKQKRCPRCSLLIAYDSPSLEEEEEERGEGEKSTTISPAYTYLLEGALISQPLKHTS